MIHTVKEEIYIAVYLILFGVYLLSTYDAFSHIKRQIKIPKVVNIILEVIFCLLQVYITYLFSYRLQDGYIPIYFILFMFIGWFLYVKFFKKGFLKVINGLGKIIVKVTPTARKVSANLVYAPELMKWIRNMVAKIIQKIKHFIAQSQAKKRAKAAALQQENEIILQNAEQEKNYQNNLQDTTNVV